MPDMLARVVVTILLGLMPFASAAAACTPPKPTLEDGARDSKVSARPGRDEGVAVRNAMALRGGVSEDMWLEALHRLTRVPASRREAVTRLVRGYIVEATAWRTTQAPEMKRLTEVIVASRKSGETPPIEVTTKVRRIRSEMPRLSDLQEKVWEILSGPEQSRLVDEITAVKKTGLPKDVEEGRRPAGSPITPASEATAAEKPSTPAEDGTTTAAESATPVPALWSFIDDPNAGKPLPEPEPDTPEG